MEESLREEAPRRRRPRFMSVRVGTVLGFDLDLHFSWFFIFVLLLWSTTFQVLPLSFGGFSAGEYAVMGAVCTLLFFASLVAHEVSHALVARAKGIPVYGITLFVFGGIARVGKEASTPGEEALIAGVGPLCSFVLGLLFGLVAWAASTAEIGAGLFAVSVSLAYVNIGLAVFNLLPGFPMDGGRLLRAAVWRLTGDMTRGTRVAARAGRWLGIGLMAFGIWQAFTQSLVGGLWMVLIGAFLRRIAAAAYEQHLLRRRLAAEVPQ